MFTKKLPGHGSFTGRIVTPVNFVADKKWGFRRGGISSELTPPRSAQTKAWVGTAISHLLALLKFGCVACVPIFLQ